MTTTDTTIRYWEAFTAHPVAERHETHAEETPEGPASVWTCGHRHRYEYTAEECAERSCRELSGPNGTEVQYVGVRRVER